MKGDLIVQSAKSLLACDADCVCTLSSVAGRSASFSKANVEKTKRRLEMLDRPDVAHLHNYLALTSVVRRNDIPLTVD